MSSAFGSFNNIINVHLEVHSYHLATKKKMKKMKKKKKVLKLVH